MHGTWRQRPHGPVGKQCLSQDAVSLFVPFTDFKIVLSLLKRIVWKSDQPHGGRRGGMDPNMSTSNTRIGTFGGTLAVLIFQLAPEDLLRTAILAGTGAAVSFVVSSGLRVLVKWWKQL
jgi:hypothetical protein